MAVDMTARASTPGTRKSSGSRYPVSTRSTLPKKTRIPTGIPRVTMRLSPRRSVSLVSTSTWAPTPPTRTSVLPWAAPTKPCGPGGLQRSDSRATPAAPASGPFLGGSRRLCRGDTPHPPGGLLFLPAGGRRFRGHLEEHLLQGPPPGPQVAEGHAVVPQPGGQGGHQLRARGGVDDVLPGFTLGDRRRGQEQGVSQAGEVEAGGGGEPGLPTAGGAGQVAGGAEGHEVTAVDDGHPVAEAL